MGFADRRDGGQRLAEKLTAVPLVDPVVLALPRGGVPVAFEVAEALRAPLDVFVTRKIGAPHQPEYGIGAVAEGGGVVLDRSAVEALELTRDELDALVEAEFREVSRRVYRYRGTRSLPGLDDRDVVLVDVGLATGVTAEASVLALRAHHPRRVILAVPAAAQPSRTRLAGIADEVVCVIAPPDFRAVGRWYERFDQTSDEEVVDLLESSLAARR
jgi:putative phosphoribosyl transferase